MVELPVGPYRQVDVDGEKVPFYILPFDKAGRCQGPRTRADALRRITSEGITDVFLFSHGWNNDWATATERYESFLAGYSDLRRAQGLRIGRDYRPLMVGVFWPSTSLVMPGERAPRIADPTTAQARHDAAVAEERGEVAAVAELLPAAEVDRFYELVQREDLDGDEALELATIIAPLRDRPDDELGDDAGPGRDQLDHLVELWRCLPDLDQDGAQGDEDPEKIEAELEEFGLFEPGADGEDGPRAAGMLDKLRPRNVVRAMTVWLMKDRAGTVGAGGVSEVLVDILGSSDARVHMIGHSYGGKVCLSALCAPATLPRPVTSMLLLQPAVSHLCFAESVPGRSHPGGYVDAPDRLRHPLLTTYSRRDVPLRRLFHLAVRRHDDLAELRIAGDEPDRYAALGGYGPRGRAAGCRDVDAKKVGDPYDLEKPGVIAIHASEVISGHGDISNDATWWALYQLVSADL